MAFGCQISINPPPWRRECLGTHCWQLLEFRLLTSPSCSGGSRGSKMVQGSRHASEPGTRTSLGVQRGNFVWDLYKIWEGFYFGKSQVLRDLPLPTKSFCQAWAWLQMLEAGEGEGFLGSSTVQMLAGGKLWVASTRGPVWGCTQALCQCSPHPLRGRRRPPCWPLENSWEMFPYQTGNVCSELCLCFTVTWLQQVGGQET